MSKEEVKIIANSPLQGDNPLPDNEDLIKTLTLILKAKHGGVVKITREEYLKVREECADRLLAIDQFENEDYELQIQVTDHGPQRFEDVPSN